MIGGELTIANLKRRIEELEHAERLQIQLSEKMQEERDALATHVENAAGIMHRLAESPAHIDGEAPPAVRAYLDWYLAKPASSLARRDALIKAAAFAEAGVICQKVKQGQDALAWMHKEVSPVGEEYIGEHGILYSNKAFGAEHCVDDLKREENRLRHQAEEHQ
ncbi:MULTISPECIES: hypothetical protein [unclassified Halomonas]|uniref:hypothetical protein n=1 Tax=unclassified Halomonas TaxID=2609666 RepID=UPI002076AF04|nr:MULTISPECIES: hypothetical protein [unclassified Halomonas]